jgi:hypothetical protein
MLQAFAHWLTIAQQTLLETHETLSRSQKAALALTCTNGWRKGIEKLRNRWAMRAL